MPAAAPSRSDLPQGGAKHVRPLRMKRPCLEQRSSHTPMHPHRRSCIAAPCLRGLAVPPIFFRPSSRRSGAMPEILFHLPKSLRVVPIFFRAAAAVPGPAANFSRAIPKTFRETPKTHRETPVFFRVGTKLIREIPNIFRVTLNFSRALPNFFPASPKFSANL